MGKAGWKPRNGRKLKMEIAFIGVKYWPSEFGPNKHSQIWESVWSSHSLIPNPQVYLPIRGYFGQSKRTSMKLANLLCYFCGSLTLNKIRLLGWPKRALFFIHSIQSIDKVIRDLQRSTYHLPKVHVLSTFSYSLVVMLALGQSLNAKTGIYVNIKHALKRITYMDGTDCKPRERTAWRRKLLHIRVNTYWRKTRRFNSDILFHWALGGTNQKAKFYR